MRIELTKFVGRVEDVSRVPKFRQLAVFLGEDRYFSLTMPRAMVDEVPKALALRLAALID